MKKYRTTTLMAVLLCLVGYYIFQSQNKPVSFQDSYTLSAPLDGSNEIIDVSIKPDERQKFMVEVKYRFRGDIQNGMIRAYALQTASSSPPQRMYGQRNTKKGINTGKVAVVRDRSYGVAHSTRIVRVDMYSWADKKVVASKDIEFPIDWPRMKYGPVLSQSVDKDVDALYKEAVAEIDYGSEASLQNARVKLENIVTRDADYVPVYPELARYHMKTNWGPEGLRQAERALNSGLAIDPDHANSYVLIGYVYAHQGRHKEAWDAFSKAEKFGTDNLWLWVNWGELFFMQGKVADSMAMYRKAVDGERTYSTYDRAREDAYKRLINLYGHNNEYDLVDEMHLKRISEYKSDACFPFYYAKFRQHQFGDTEVTLKYAKQALDADCQYDEQIRKVIGTVYYTKWNNATSQDERRSNLTQAQLYFAEGPELIYWLSKSKETTPVIKGLLEDGLSIDVMDNESFTALAYATRDDNIEASKRLITMGADPNTAIGEQEVPILAIAVIGRSKESVAYLVDNGADINAQVNEGVTVHDLARGLGYSEIVEVFNKSGGKHI